MLDLAFRAERSSPEPVYRQLADHLAALIETGRLPVGDRIPPTRELAEALGLSRNTVSRAYEALGETGFLAAHVGRGTFVARGGADADGRSPVRREATRFAWQALLARRARETGAPRGLRLLDESRVRFDLRAGRVDPNALPVAEIQGAYQRALGRALRHSANDFDPLGFAPLREAIARALAGRGIACKPEQVLVVSGAQQALDLVARALLDPGDVALVEEPGYFGATLAFRACEAQLIGVGIDADGLRVDELERILRTRRPKLLYTTPAVQLPTTVALADARRQALLEVADRAQLPILEDDYDCELRLGGPVAPALKQLDPGEHVIYVGTFSKALFPGLRLGYAVAARPLLAALSRARLAASFQPSLVDQMALAELLRGDVLERHVRRVRKRYADRVGAVLQALEGAFPSHARWRPPAGGSAVWVEFDRPVDHDALSAAALREGIAYGAGDAFWLGEERVPGLQISFATLEPDALREAVAGLGALLRQHFSNGRRT